MDDDERSMEIEALSAIFIEGEELQLINENELVITCDPRRDDDSQTCSMRIKFELPDGYPAEESPRYEIVDADGIGDEDMKCIVTIIGEVIEQNIGAPVLYAIVEAVNEKLAHCVHGGEQGGAESDESDGEEDSADATASLDTGLHIKQLCPETERVTREMFEDWSKKFRLEMIKKGVWRDIDAASNKGQMTGREIFESQPVGIDLDENENVFWNNEALYDEDCDEEALE
ncbi:RWD domain-containing protein 1 [Babesia sp. Xinjiang]|uniref:RWD domain-containing protein 1 n=1 Tax=Babesia sp. Xinjiang TaxID=462227 RepID=UPI000A24007A|nr:RWD domain-containing protein 1 [Babesia sp. Xinjiang]ORM40795.1 RWD domain-containing protein 1 [Babesia sp. Xinjiang]